MATKQKQSTRRAEVRKDRQARRAEILAKWEDRKNERYALEQFSEFMGGSESYPSFGSIANALIVLSPYAHGSQMLEVTEYGNDIEKVRALVGFLARIIFFKEMPYEDYLQTDEWKIRASAAKERYDGACALDATHKAEHAHHRTYTRRGREFVDDLIPLCADCHAKFHDKGPYRR